MRNNKESGNMNGRKENVKRMTRKCRNQIGPGLWGLLLILCLFAGITPLYGNEAAEKPPVSVEMIDTGQGLCILIQADTEALLYDGGGRGTSSKVVSTLASRGITSLRYLVSSHYDEDHLAGLIGVLYTNKAEQILCADYEVDTAIYESFIKAAAQSSAQMIHPEVGQEYPLGNGTVTILGPDSRDNDQENDRCVAVRFCYGEFSCVITGDAQETEEQQMLESGLALESDLLIAGHHGSSNSCTEAFLDHVNPSAVFISAGAGNPYGHPHELLLKRLAERKIAVYRTDLQGNVTAYSDGYRFWFSQDPVDEQDNLPGDQLLIMDPDSRSREAEENLESGRTADDTPDSGSEMHYVLNTNTMKFHVPDCRSVTQMSEKNRQEYTGSREDLIARGFSPCGNCHP